MPKVVTVNDLWQYIERRGPNECWPWTGGRSGVGYGAARVCFLYQLRLGPCHTDFG